jgi:hypothetical protein
MWFRKLFDSLAATPSRNLAGRARREASRGRRAASRLQLEALEDRCLPSFLPAVSYPVGASPRAVVTGDFNGDGRLDLAVVNTNSDTVSILLGKGDGTFQPAQTYATGHEPGSLAVGDFNGDGKLDIVTTNYGTVSVLLGNGDGTFQAPIDSTLPNLYGGAVAVGDMNHDGKLDLVVSGQGIGWGTTTNPDSVDVLLGNGAGGFALASTTLFSPNQPPGPVALADFNADGKLDIAVVLPNAYEGQPGAISVLLGNGDGTVGPPTNFATGSLPHSLAVGDFNGDGKLDLVTATGPSVSVLLGNGDGTFKAPVNTTLPGISPAVYTGLEPLPLPQSPTRVVVGDLNGDGKLDLAVMASWGYSVGGGGYYGGGTTPVSFSNVNVLLGHGDGTFTDAHIVPLSGTNPSAITTGNFKNKTMPDLAVTDSAANTVSVLLNAADWSTPAPQASNFAVSGFPSPTTAGVAGSFTVTAKNTDGTTATGYTGTVHFTSSDGQAVLPADYTFMAADQGIHTFSAILKTAGTQSITATDTTTSGLTGSEAGITVTPAAASQFAVNAPAGSTAGSAFSVTLTALDPYNNTATGYTGTVHFKSTDGQASLPGDYTFTAADAGMHTFTNGVILKTAGSKTVTASDPVTASITGSAAVAVSPAAASTMIVTGFPSPITAGVAGTLTVTLKDLYGNIASGYAGMVLFTSSDGKASLPANYTFTAADAGVHTFSATLKTAGTQSLTATDTKTASLIGTDGGITVKPAAASQFVLRAPASVSAGVALSLTITVKDAFGNVVTGYTGTIHFTSTDTTATLPRNYTFTAADKGVHTFSGLVLRKRGTQKITLTDTLNSSLTGSVIVNVV